MRAGASCSPRMLEMYASIEVASAVDENVALTLAAHGVDAKFLLKFFLRDGALIFRSKMRRRTAGVLG